MSTQTKLCIVGGGGVGKTSLTVSFVSNHFVEYYDPTIEDSYRKQVVIDEQACLVEILDTAGQEELSAMRDQWIRSCEGFLVVYSCTSRISFDEVTELVNQVLRVHDADTMPIMIVGNKCDLNSDRVVSTEEGKELAKCLQAGFYEASAKTRLNVENVFIGLVKSVWEKQGRKDSKTKSGKKKQCNII
eukprot:TRINITY_DN2091_c0_g2_i1.p1 TRINITY_DN2091_c0_g2~~TRINITY_DN2091_c0_g2_i1.p1  ORF type:complete len:188 (-),score=30.41 TRINITY_DN2091_c0_g2_i1:150-713(-)